MLDALNGIHERNAYVGRTLCDYYVTLNKLVDLSVVFSPPR